MQGPTHASFCHRLQLLLRRALPETKPQPLVFGFSLALLAPATSRTHRLRRALVKNAPPCDKEPKFPALARWLLQGLHGFILSVEVLWSGVQSLAAFKNLFASEQGEGRYLLLSLGAYNNKRTDPKGEHHKYGPSI